MDLEHMYEDSLNSLKQGLQKRTNKDSNVIILQDFKVKF